MYQRKRSTYVSSPSGTDKIMIDIRDLITYCDDAQKALESINEDDSALRFELLAEYLRTEFKGGRLTFNYKSIGV